MNNYNDINSPTLRAWNRAVTVLAAYKKGGADKVAEYTKQFTQEDKNNISYIFQKVRADGYESTRAEVNRKVQNGS